MRTQNLFIILTGALAASTLVFAPITHSFFFWLLYRCMFVADSMFHELGHAVFDWAFGMPALPSIFTLFGGDQAGGVTIAIERSWLAQALAFAALGYGCTAVKRHYPSLFWVATVVTVAVTVIAFTRYYRIVVLYMGHGGSICMGGFFLWRAWRDEFTRNAYKRWADAFLGFFLVLHNMHFAWMLATSAGFRQEYSGGAFGGAIDNDFVQMTDLVWRWSLHGIALFTLACCVLALVIPPLLAYWLDDDEAF